MRIAIVLLLLAGCAAPVQHYKIIGVPYEKTRTVTKARKCPPLPALPADPTQSQLTAHHRAVIELYGRCAK